MSLNLLQIFSNSGCSSSPYDRVGNGFFREFRNNLRTYFGGGDGYVATFMENNITPLFTGHNLAYLFWILTYSVTLYARQAATKCQTQNGLSNFYLLTSATGLQRQLYGCVFMPDCWAIVQYPRKHSKILATIFLLLPTVLNSRVSHYSGRSHYFFLPY